MSSDDPVMRITIAQHHATAEEVAAVAVAVTALAAQAAPTPPARGPAWSRAARLEQTGQAPFTTAVDPRLVHRPSGVLPPGASRSLA